VKSDASGAAGDSPAGQFTPLTLAQFLGKTQKSGLGIAAQPSIRLVIDALTRLNSAESGTSGAEEESSSGLFSPMTIALTRVKSYASGADEESSSGQFTPFTIASFLGKTVKSGSSRLMASQSVRLVIDALELVDLGILRRDAIDTLPTWDALEQVTRDGWRRYETRE